jgi:hypothetical protein
MSQFKDIHSLLSFAICLLYLPKERLTQAHQAQPEPCVYLRPCRSKPERFEGSARLLALLECFVVFILELPHLNIIISSSILNVSFDSENKILGSRHDCPWVGSAVAWSFILCSNLRSSEPGITLSCKVVIKFLGLTASRWTIGTSTWSSILCSKSTEAGFTTWLPLHLTTVHEQHKNFKIKSRKSLLLVLSHD